MSQINSYCILFPACILRAIYPTGSHVALGLKSDHQILEDCLTGFGSNPDLISLLSQTDQLC